MMHALIARSEEDDSGCGTTCARVADVAGDEDCAAAIARDLGPITVLRLYEVHAQQVRTHRINRFCCVRATASRTGICAPRTL